MPQNSNEPTDWGQAWLDTQKKYWDTWMDMGKQMTGQPQTAKPASADPWGQSLDFWAKAMTSLMPSESRDLVSKLFDLNKGYLQMGEGLQRIMASAQDTVQGTEGWWESVTRGFEHMQKDVAARVSGSTDPWAGFATFWGMPLDTWRRVGSACSVMPGDMEKALRGSGAPYGPEAIHGAVSGWLSTPTLGYTREWQEQIQCWSQLWMDHGRAVQEYGAVLAKVGARAAELLMEKLRNLPGEERGVENLRGVYNLWVDCGEEAYAEVSSSEEFTEAQACLTNTLMAVKNQEQEMVNEILAGLNMPTRNELDTSHRRVHELERLIWKMQEQLESAGVRELREEVSALRRELERAGQETAVVVSAGAPPDAPAASPPAPRRTTVRKKTVAKKTGAAPKA